MLYVVNEENHCCNHHFVPKFKAYEETKVPK